MFKKKIKQAYDAELKKLRIISDFLNSKKLQNFEKLCTISIKSRERNKIIFFGNGGSAADSYI